MGGYEERLAFEPSLWHMRHMDIHRASLCKRFPSEYGRLVAYLGNNTYMASNLYAQRPSPSMEQAHSIPRFQMKSE